MGKQQSTGEMVLEMMRSVGFTSEQVTTVGSLRIAMLHTPEKRLKWALNFAAQQLNELSKPDWLKLRLQVGAFRLQFHDLLQGVEGSERVPISEHSGFFPTDDQIQKIQTGFRDLLKQWEQFGFASFAFGGETTVTAERGQTAYRLKDQVADCKRKFLEVLAPAGDLARRCPEDQKGCGEWFLAGRKDQVYCSRKCVNRVTLARFRATHAKPKKHRRAS